jgi:serine/threonine protein kinase
VKILAMKIIRVPVTMGDRLSKVDVMKGLSHPNIVKLNTSLMDKSRLCLVLEYAKDGDLGQMIASYKERRMMFAEREIWNFAGQLSLGLLYLHS